MKKYIKLLRIKHYIKNLLIFLPLVFNKNITVNSIIQIFIGFIAFSISSSIIYIINDIMDVEKDRNHPIKKKRPIASGEITVKKALFIDIVLAFILIALMIYLSMNNVLNMVYILTYITINFAYSLGLKNIPILDVFILSLGFILRVLFGGSLINVEVSQWLFLTVLSFSFYLGLGKRRNELINISDGKEVRKVLEFYSKDFLDKNMYMYLATTIVFYSLWCKEISASNFMMWTIPIIIMICMKYSLNIESNYSGDPVEVLLKDKLLILLVLIYCITVFIGLYIIGV